MDEDAGDAAEACKEKGNAFYRDGKYNEAVEQYSQAIAKRPDTVTYYNNRAAAYLMQEQYGKCVADCEKVWMEFFFFFFSLGFYWLCGQVLQSFPKDVKALLRASKAHIRRGETDAAKRKLVFLLFYDLCKSFYL
jgi:tetratricopeptide (TPR) repeat protein